MPRNQKRKAGEIDYDDPLAFVAEYCRRREIPYQTGRSDAEQECLRRASEAREEFKSRRDATGSDPNGDSANVNDPTDMDRKGLSPAQKYMIRLQNNRRSASASKVYNEVLKREQAACLQKLSTLQAAPQSEAKNTDTPDRPTLEEVAELRKEVKRLKSLLEKKEQAQNESSRKNYDVLRGCAKREVDLQILTELGSPPTTNRGNSSESSLHDTPSPKRPSPRKKGRETGKPMKEPEYSLTQATQHIATGTIGESQQEHTLPASSQENLTRSQAQRNSSHPYSMSLSQSDMKDLQTGVNLSQSQPDHQEEIDEKGQLVRNLPRSGGIPVAVLDSQPSQSEGAPSKYHIGSEDLNMSGPDYIGSQSTIEGGTPKKPRLA